MRRRNSSTVRTSIAALVAAVPALTLLAVPEHAAAQMSPRVSQEVVVTATVAPAPLETLGQTVTVLTREDLDRLGLTSVIDALRLTPGVDVRARGPRDVQTDFSIRAATFGQSLVLVDGLRLNDSQTGHHNGDIPIAMAGLDRIEIVEGAGSTVHGADALGGTINFISRRDAHTSGEIAVGQYGYTSAEGSVSGTGLPADWTATGWGSRSSGFAFDREFAIGGGALRGQPAPGWTIDVRHQRKAFGAAGFYGNSPSKEWTDQTLTSTTWDAARGAWTREVRATWRNHGDHFRWDIAQPGFAENHHRTNSGELSAQFGRDLGGDGRLTIGGGTGGDWVRSTNLGNRNFLHQDLYAEVQIPIAARATIVSGLRFDTYSTFGQSWNPSFSVASHLAGPVRVRASAQHAFRIPTFTELYYHDPANLGSPDLHPEHGWSLDGGLDWMPGRWVLSASPFARWDRDVIDWVRATPQDLWRSTNVRDVTTTGVELSAARRWAGALIRANFTGQSVDAPALGLLSKYVLEYAPRSYGLAVTTPVSRGWQLAGTVDRREREDGQRYTLVGARVARRLGRASVFLDGTNLLDREYHEIAGVAMPGRWMSMGVRFD